eukprot:CAMPEP_0174359496 /NCGR_PEP_ID=MMETSP0811_2-20130205/49067_1 /TAXON_ID=73025 ORGANISM="Eutreptiella gymnastica-like, Strain CCMP1594" /NCGR_SAMPLE_ID=MMETSP0811_2 /ASSEMBLY_ACC=CAM_ASM_000667 /LENGTH=142 /DNA_ID=CAMNT_0015494271 /DNA_START=1114 /DNA_END=1539 /DNA_ORIENTATION=-
MAYLSSVLCMHYISSHEYGPTNSFCNALQKSYQGTGQLTFDRDERLKRLNLIYAACCGLIALSCLCTFVSSPLRDRQECMPSTMRRCIMSEVFGNLTGSCYPAVPVDEDSGYSWCLDAPRSGQCDPPSACVCGIGIGIVAQQ